VDFNDAALLDLNFEFKICDPKTSGFTFYLQPLKEAVSLRIEAVP
jgi:hypothetical protein